MTMPVSADVSLWESYYAGGRDFRPVLDEEKSAFDKTVPPRPGSTAIDIGCGTGGFARFLRERSYTVLGLDCSSHAAAKATAASAHDPGATFRPWNAETDSWNSVPAADLISCRLSYAFIRDKTSFLQRVRSRLLPGGVFYVMTPVAEDLPDQRKETGISAEEARKLCEGWASVDELRLDAHHVRYAMTV
ncbi:class I SAM-dependent methyltransferase [Streptomyces laurentii]|uniref:class I SAM-dependent methyltransferase n=1 Tax=Streptomyces laurentii TaxID=39478 RepID=UPI0036BE71E7